MEDVSTTTNNNNNNNQQSSSSSSSSSNNNSSSSSSPPSTPELFTRERGLYIVNPSLTLADISCMMETYLPDGMDSLEKLIILQIENLL